MSLYKQRNSPYWWVSIYHKGQRIRRPTSTADRAKAKLYHDKLVADLWNQDKLEALPGYTWTDAVKEWLHAGARGLEDRYRLRWITARLEETPLAELAAPKSTILSDLLAEKRAEGAKPGTLRRYVSLIHGVLSAAKERGWISTVPKMTWAPKPSDRVRWLTGEQWTGLEPLLPPHLRQLARFTLATGLRRHNATHLTWDRVNFRQRLAWVQAEDVKQRETLGIPLNDDALAVLQEQRGLHERWVFPYKGKPVHLTSTKAWREALAAAGIQDFRWHDLRHTWASWHVMNGTNLRELMDLGGWKTVEMVKRYAHLSHGRLAKVAQNVKPVSLSQTSSALGPI
jgi:integrase